MLHPPARTRSSRRGPRRPAPTGRSCRTPRGVRVLRYARAAEVGDLVAQTIRGKDVLLIASSDFTHVGSQYFQIAPAGVTAPAFAKGQDAKAIEQIVALDPKHFAAKVAQDDISMCGYGAVTAMLTAAKVLGAREAKLLKYATSSDVSRDTKMAVGYGAIAVYR